MEYVFMSWDMAFKDADESDYVVGQVWGVSGSRRYLLDQVRDQLSFVATIQAFRQLSAKWPQAAAKYVEDTANGPAVISTLRDEIPGIIPVPAKGSKESRVHAVAPYVEAGNVWIPDPVLAPWVGDFVSECAMFNRGPHDDQVDAFTQAMIQSGLASGAVTMGAYVPNARGARRR